MSDDDISTGIACAVIALAIYKVTTKLTANLLNRDPKNSMAKIFGAKIKWPLRKRWDDRTYHWDNL